MVASKSQPVLPIEIAGSSDVARLMRELETMADELHQSKLRDSKAKPKLPRVSRLLGELASLNKWDFLQPADCKTALDFLQSVRTSAPLLTISFATDPSAAFMVKLVTWLRQNIHPLVLVRVGLQPTIAAGCTVRTANHYYDMSLRANFARQKPKLLERITSLETKP